MRFSITSSTQGATKIPTRLISFDEASRLIAAHATPLGVERIPLDTADGRLLAEPVHARRTSPSTLVSAMDGYAVRESDLAELPVSLKIAGKSLAGAGFNGALPPHACIRIFTGAPAPAGADRVVIQEDVREEDGAAIFAAPLSKRCHLRPPGSDFAKGDLIVPSRSVLTPQRLIAVAASDIADLEVFRQPRVAILCCGDELAEPGYAGRSPDEIPESISYGIAALVRRWGGTMVARWRRPDDLGSLHAAAAAASAVADVVVLIGGASVGERDFAKDAFTQLQMELLFTKIAIRPGRPVWFGKAGKTLIVGLPGNPTSALVTARLFLAPLLAGLSGGNTTDALNWRMMRASVPLDGSNDRDVFLCATVVARGAISLSVQNSSGQKALADATHLIRCRSGKSFSNAKALLETLAL